MSLGVQIMQSDLTTLTYIELEHAQPNLHLVLLGVVDRRGRYSNIKPQLFVALVTSVVPIQAKPSLFFLQFLIVWSLLQLTRVPKSPDQAIFMLTTTTDEQTDCFSPCCTCARVG